jgi:hypothetical protein
MCPLHLSLLYLGSHHNCRRQQTPPRITKLDDKTGHNCKMPHTLYITICNHILGIQAGSFSAHQSEKQFCNMLLQDINALLHYYCINYYSMFANSQPTKHSKPVSLPDNPSDMARILAHLTRLLLSAQMPSHLTYSTQYGTPTKKQELPLVDHKVTCH